MSSAVQAPKGPKQFTNTQSWPPRSEEGQRHGISKPNQRWFSPADMYRTFKVRNLTKNQYRTPNTTRISRSLLTSYRPIARVRRPPGACAKIPYTRSCKRGVGGCRRVRRIREMGEADLGLRSRGKNGLPPDGLVPLSRFT
jgi:hypothetical protein